ncbi:MAG: L,D-transpeptidase family protein [Deltaproteobacteria bacterium]|jgi:murein L,D-transpeptidase YafK/ketosteroid isomerase-like protein|nr:L,D-transpeptidase family protein [Deltaproteobacteria bacterium]
MIKILLLQSALCLLFCAPAAAASSGGWQAVISDYAQAPPFMLAVDKKEQLVSLFERRSPLAKIAEYPCTTGQNQGDKLEEGDMRTPEGVYFVAAHISSGLNYALYGNEAYPLNYPNPVDRLRRKTGYGIWLHGRGGPLLPFDSNGCVALNNNDLDSFKARLFIGQPIALASNVFTPGLTPEKSGERASTAALLASRVEDWARAWSGRSNALFDFYDPEAYALAQGQKFSLFREQKESLFRRLPWIRTSVSDIQVLEGPGYWVTWFNQDYAAPNLRTSGTRRLYWQADSSGEMRIVGMEWIQNLKSPVLYADAGSEIPSLGPALALPAKSASPSGDSEEALQFINAWSQAWKRRDLPAYAACYAENAVQGKRRGREDIAAHKEKLWSGIKIAALELHDIRLEKTPAGFKALLRQEYRDSEGYADEGGKTLYLEASGGVWRIAREDWAPLRRDAGLEKAR